MATDRFGSVIAISISKPFLSVRFGSVHIFGIGSYFRFRFGSKNRFWFVYQFGSVDIAIPSFNQVLNFNTKL